MRRDLSLLPAVLVTAAAACGDDDGPSGRPDARPADARDATSLDSGPADAGSDGGADAGLDAGPQDADDSDAGTSQVGLRIPGLTDEVTVRFDVQRVLHVDCATPEDCMAAQGYFHAAHRFGQMDFSRRVVQGRLTDLYWSIGLGRSTIDQDIQARTVFANRDGEPLWETLLAQASPRTRGYLEAYTRGVNAWIDDLAQGRNDAQLSPAWSVFRNRIDRWTVEDTISTVLLLVEQLTNRVAGEIAFSRSAVALSPAELIDFAALPPPTTTVISPDATGTRTRESSRRDRERLLESARAYQRWVRKASFPLAATGAKLGPPEPHGGAIGSNNWVLRSAQTADGATLLANDPHLQLSNPALWYLVNLDATRDGGSFHVAGVSFPGFPGILLGQNGDIAWGATTTTLDQSDAYLEQVVFDGATPVGVRFRGETVPFTVDTETFADPDDGSASSMDLLYVPHHGPVLDLDPGNQTATTLRWSGQDISTDVEVFPDLWEATDVDTARAALEGSTTLGQNFVVIDDQDNIGWFPYNDVPSRPWASLQSPPWAILDGSSGDFEWGEPIPLAELPQSKNPARGWILTANNAMNDNLADGDPTNDGTPYLQGGVAPGYRATRASELVAQQSGSHDADTMRAIQSDVRSLMGERTVPTILARADLALEELTAQGESVRQALDAWTFGCPTGLDGLDPSGAPPVEEAAARAESKGCLAFHVLWTRLHFAVFGDELARAGFPTDNVRDGSLDLYLTSPERFVGGPYWDDVSTPDTVETSSTVVVRALNATGEALVDALGPDESRWQWGRLHTVALRPLDGRPFVAGPFANDGGWYTVDVANPSSAKFESSEGGTFGSSYGHTAGPSMRLVCATRAASPGAPPDCTIDLPGVQRASAETGREENLMIQHWLPNAPFELRFARDEVEAAAVETVEIDPAVP